MPAVKRYRHRRTYVSTINVTPFVDVMLVLLIVFMVSAPLLTMGVSINLPKIENKPVNTDKEPLVVAVNAQGQVHFQDKLVTMEKLVEQVNKVRQANPEVMILIRGDKSLHYGKMMEIITMLTQLGVKKVALLTQQPTGSSQKRQGNVPKKAP